ncbi:hypothetical protein Ddye_009788 [Dipteronia dyeriana]|uniref:Reverse transcriptase n=1 Tax=Dipteronia dyeriana TaxID=168575 RepID=A0AAD9XCN6_9ROSI|nr:hypothetical protein Ddye_009788 [Dipteronia dyeriana]
MCAGDFSEMVNEAEKSGGRDRPRTQMENFKTTLDKCGLRAMGFIGPQFTWCNKREGPEMIQERLDRRICDFIWKMLFSLAVSSMDLLALVLDTVQLYHSSGSCGFLDSLFLPEEIHRVVFDVAPLKASCSDGLPTLFYQMFWHFVGPHVTTVCLSVLNDGVQLDGINKL